MNIIISDTKCGNSNCIGVEAYGWKKPPNPNIIIEDTWDIPQELIEEAMVGLISHETIEWLIHTMFFHSDLNSDIHDLIGNNQTFKEYAKTQNGIVIRKRTKKK